MRRISFSTAGLFTIAALCIASAAAVVWREVSSDFDPDARAQITADFVAQCQSGGPQCDDMVRKSMAWAVAERRLTRDCLARRPSAPTMSRGIVIWLNAHGEKHPLPSEQGIADAADAIWPCKSP